MTLIEKNVSEFLCSRVQQYHVLSKAWAARLTERFPNARTSHADPPAPLFPTAASRAQIPQREKMVQMAPRRWSPLAAGALLGLCAVLASFRQATGITSDIACPEEAGACLFDTDCGACLQALQTADLSLGADFSECSELFEGVSKPKQFVVAVACAPLADNVADIAFLAQESIG